MVFGGEESRRDDQAGRRVHLLQAVPSRYPLVAGDVFAFDRRLVKESAQLTSERTSTPPRRSLRKSGRQQVLSVVKEMPDFNPAAPTPREISQRGFIKKLPFQRCRRFRSVSSSSGWSSQGHRHLRRRLKVIAISVVVSRSSPSPSSSQGHRHLPAVEAVKVNAASRSTRDAFAINQRARVPSVPPSG